MPSILRFSSSLWPLTLTIQCNNRSYCIFCIYFLLCIRLDNARWAIGLNRNFHFNLVWDLIKSIKAFDSHLKIVNRFSKCIFCVFSILITLVLKHVYRYFLSYPNIHFVCKWSVFFSKFKTFLFYFILYVPYLSIRQNVESSKIFPIKSRYVNKLHRIYDEQRCLFDLFGSTHLFRFFRFEVFQFSNSIRIPNSVRFLNWVRAWLFRCELEHHFPDNI